MEYTYLTGTGMQVSRFCLGTWTFGEQLSEQDAIRAVDYALDQGVNFFDTANMYVDGASESILGKALLHKREQVVLASKVGNERSAAVNGQGCSRRNILLQVEKTLKRLQTDYLDLYYLHTPDPHTPLEEVVETMDSLVRSGKVRYLGVSNFPAWQVCTLHHLAKSTNRVGPVVNQMVYNMITRGLEQEFIPFAKHYGQGIVVYNPVAGGFLTDKYADKKIIDGSRFSRVERYQDRYWNEDSFRAWDACKAIADEAGVTLYELAMRWIYSIGHVDSIVIGFSNQTQLEFNVKSLDRGALSPDIMNACEQVWNQLKGTRFAYAR